jgi:Tfp pilus assembly protein PilO
MNLRSKLDTTEILNALSNLHRRARLSLFEIGSLAAALIFAVIVLFFYLTKIQPLSSQAAALRGKELGLRQQLEKESIEERRRTEQSANAEKILDSLTKFESNLKPDESGMIQILDEISALCKTHKIISDGSRYNVTEPDPVTDENGNPITRRVTREKLDFYKVLGIDTTVTGDYRNLRRFIYDLERSKQFLVINSVQFQGEAERLRRGQGNNGGGPNQQFELSSPEAIPVSLKIEMDTYFQKPSEKSQ